MRIEGKKFNIYWGPILAESYGLKCHWNAPDMGLLPCNGLKQKPKRFHWLTFPILAECFAYYTYVQFWFEPRSKIQIQENHLKGGFFFYDLGGEVELRSAPSFLN
jgi:hypothetical protein